MIVLIMLASITAPVVRSLIATLAKKEGWLPEDVDDHEDDSYGPGMPK